MTDQEKIELAVLSQKFEDWTIHHDIRADERHSEMSKKIDDIMSKFDEVPCKKICKNDWNIKVLWGFLSATILAIVGAYFKR